MCSDIRESWRTLTPQPNRTIFLPKLETELTNDPASLLVGTYPKKMASTDLRAIWITVITTALSQ